MCGATVASRGRKLDLDPPPPHQGGDQRAMRYPLVGLQLGDRTVHHRHLLFSQEG